MVFSVPADKCWDGTLKQAAAVSFQINYLLIILYYLMAESEILLTDPPINKQTNYPPIHPTNQLIDQGTKHPINQSSIQIINQPSN
jgi:hypothetical protein